MKMGLIIAVRHNLSSCEIKKSLKNSGLHGIRTRCSALPVEQSSKLGALISWLLKLCTTVTINHAFKCLTFIIPNSAYL